MVLDGTVFQGLGVSIRLPLAVNIQAGELLAFDLTVRDAERALDSDPLGVTQPLRLEINGLRLEGIVQPITGMSPPHSFPGVVRVVAPLGILSTELRIREVSAIDARIDFAIFELANPLVRLNYGEFAF